MYRSASFAAVAFLTFSLSSAVAAVDFYVAPYGDDAQAGTADEPFATLERARDAVREARRAQGEARGPVTVYLRGGVYPRTDTFALTEQDSGTADARVVYRAYEGEEVRLAGGKAISGFQPVGDAAVLARLPESAREHVLETDLKAQGIPDFGVMKMRGFPQPILPAPLELFYNGAPMTLARWPNEGWALTGAIIDRGSVPRDDDFSNRGGTFVYTDDRPARWTSAEDVWMFGYWCWDWADEYIPVASIDVEKREITLGAPHHYGLKEGMRYYALNLLEEIDQPGEWYLDRASDTLYFWPPGPIDAAEIWVSLLEMPMVTMRDVSHVVFQGVTFECMRGTALQMVGGAGNRIADCTFRNIGDVAVILGEGENDRNVVGLLGCSVHSRSYQDTAWNRNAGTNHRIENCHLYNLGEGGIILGGGDRLTLTPGANAVVGSHIHNYSRSVTTNRPAVWLDGVGNRAAHNRIHDAPHTAIMFWGNDHAVEFNEIFDVCKETGDVGVIYTGRDWTMRGTAVRYNYIHDVHGPGHIGAQGIYLDDQASGSTCFGNVLVNVERAFLIGGGRDNIVENNLIVNCGQSIYFDARGVGAGDENQSTLKKRLEAVPYQAEPWRSRYPGLATILEGDPRIPSGNVVRNNALCGGGEMHIDDHVRQHSVVERNVSIEEDPQFVDPATGNYALRDGSPVFRAIPGFEQIPFESIGSQRQTR